ncbi:unnamed protein product [Vicia faba]|uniref:Uncharacterized protein n=1 Tax=Vicia faba TaxID=3906 RepID=A0AAV0ZT43_VICFA|nr:unnamed protein product [Vicia faba]
MKSTLNFLSLSPIFSSSSKHSFANPNFQTMSILSPCKPFQNPKTSTTISFLTFLPPPPISIYKNYVSVKLNQENFLTRRQFMEPVIKGHKLDRFLDADVVNGDNADSINDDFDELLSCLFSTLTISILTQFQFRKG